MRTVIGQILPGWNPYSAAMSIKAGGHDKSSAASMSVGCSRRRFLAAASALSIPWFWSRPARAVSANGKLQHACIGADGMGWSDLNSLASHPRIEIVAICDVDTARMEKAREKFPQARCYQDWRELLATEADQIDSVNVSVPDHMHAAISLSAIRRGKHVYCQKPLTHDVAEARALRLAAETARVTTQMGNQIQSAQVYRTAVKWLRDGVIGKIQAVHAWTGAKYTGPGRPEGADPVPASLQWDHWLGVAPERPFKQGIYHPFQWRVWQDFGGGSIGDFGCHILDTPFKGLDLTAPLTIEAEVPAEWADNDARRRENWPDWEIIHYTFPRTPFTAGITLPVTWYDSGKQPARELFGYPDEATPIPGSGALFLGETGRLLVPHVGPPQLLPGSENAAQVLEEVPGVDHYHTFVDACLGQGATTSNFRYAGPLTEATLLGGIAVRVPGQKLVWHADEMKLEGNAEAQALVARTPRAGWLVE